MKNKNLPPDFLNEMQELLSEEEYARFLVDCQGEPYRGIRINTLKCDEKLVISTLPFVQDRTPFCGDGFYINSDTVGIGNEPLHRAGAYYVQEPSAMSAVTLLDVRDGDCVLDLCASPGGKSTQIACALGGTGLLWSNEYVSSRTGALLSNIERMGIANAVVSSCRPDVLCGAMSGFFDKVLVDAPCSGEGMFRKDSRAVEEWSVQHSISCGERQLNILESASRAVRDGGTLVYSTCTFSARENEDVIEKFLEKHREFELTDSGVDFGHSAMEKAVRILPSDGGEGHFAAKLQKLGDESSNNDESSFTRHSFADTGNYSAKARRGNARRTSHDGSDIASVIALAQKLYSELFVGGSGEGHWRTVGDKVLLVPDILPPSLNGLGVIRAGLLFGEVKKNRIEPCHALFMASKPDELTRCVNLDYGDERLRRFFRGEEIEVSNTLRGYTAVSVCGLTVGFGKASGGVLKNRYPKGLREM